MNERGRRVGRGSNAALWAVAVAALGSACGSPVRPGPTTYASLAAMPPTYLAPGEMWQAKLVERGTPPVLAVASGALPEGLHLSENGTLSGRPRHPGERARFTLSAQTEDGEPLGTRSYTFVVGVGSTNLAPLTVQRDGDTLQFTQDWGKPIYDGYAWDPVLRLVWPLKVGPGINGTALAPVSGALSVCAAGPDASADFQVQVDPADHDIGIVVQLAWDGAADLDLRLLPEAGVGAGEVSKAARTLDANGTWVAKLVTDATEGPGAEAIVLSSKAPPGRYALVATRGGGDQVKTAAYLAVRGRDGKVLADEQHDLFLSDDATQAIPDEIAQGRQSWASLGVVEVKADGSVNWLSPAVSRDPFATAEVP